MKDIPKYAQAPPSADLIERTLAGAPLVELEPWEIQVGAIAGIQRTVENIELGRKDAHGAENRDGWQLTIEGALGEQAVAKHLKCYWGGKGVIHGYDVGDFEVRTTRRADLGLNVRHTDKRDTPFWCVIGEKGSYRIIGWSFVTDEVFKPEYWRSDLPNPAYYIPITDITQKLTGANPLAESKGGSLCSETPSPA